MTLIILYICFSTQFMFDCASIREITCLWNRHVRRQVCEFFLIIYTMKKTVEIVPTSVFSRADDRPVCGRRRRNVTDDPLGPSQMKLDRCR